MKTSATSKGKRKRGAHHGDSQVGMFDTQLACHNYSSKGEGTTHVDGAVVEGHGCGLVLGEEVRDEAEAHRILCRLSGCETNPGGQQLPKAVHLHSKLPTVVTRHTAGFMRICMFAARDAL